MNQEKRRRARVQGGWASGSKTVTAPGPRSDATKPKMPAPPAWVGKTIDSPAKEKFVFQESSSEIMEKPKQKVIEKAGVYDISTQPNGVSRLRLFPNFIEPADCEWMYKQLFDELQWRQRSDKKDGVEYLQPRLTAWFGDFPYSYAGVTHNANNNWTPLLVVLKDRLEENTGFKFNSMLANMYRDGHDHLPWHSDDETSLGTHPTIASLSFGDSRNFELRKKPPPNVVGEARDKAFEYSEHIKVPLDAGTLLIMEGATQEDWQHRVKREYHDRSPRINLTFRVIYPPS